MMDRAFLIVLSKVIGLRFFNRKEFSKIVKICGPILLLKIMQSGAKLCAVKATEKQGQLNCNLIEAFVVQRQINHDIAFKDVFVILQAKQPRML